MDRIGKDGEDQERTWNSFYLNSCAILPIFFSHPIHPVNFNTMDRIGKDGEDEERAWNSFGVHHTVSPDYGRS